MKDLSSGSVPKQLILFSLPFLAATVLQSLINFTDLLFVSLFSTKEGIVAGVGVGAQLCYLVINAVIGLSVGGSILISQSYGAKDMKEVQRTASNMMSLLLIAAVLVTVTMVFAAKPILRALKTPVSALNEGYSYVFVTMLGIVFIFIYNGISAILRGLGDTIRPLLFILIACIMNAALDAVAVLVFNWGADGIALATVISQAVACIIAAIYTVNKAKNLGIAKLQLKVEKEKILQILKIGMPTALLNIVASLTFLLLTYVINVAADGSPDGLTASSIVFKLNSFAILPSRSFSMSIASMVGQNVGANEPMRIKKTFFAGLTMGLIFGVVFTLTGFFSSEKLLMLFRPSESVLGFGVPYMKYISFDYVILPFAVSMYGLTDGLGRTKVSMWVNTVASLVLRLPLAYLFGVTMKLGIKGIAYAIPLTTLLSAVAMLIYILAKLRPLLRKNPSLQLK